MRLGCVDLKSNLIVCVSPTLYFAQRRATRDGDLATINQSTIF
jgi:hypothetical protein